MQAATVSRGLVRCRSMNGFCAELHCKVTVPFSDRLPDIPASHNRSRKNVTSFDFHSFFQPSCRSLPVKTFSRQLQHCHTLFIFTAPHDPRPAMCVPPLVSSGSCEAFMSVWALLLHKQSRSLKLKLKGKTTLKSIICTKK